MTPLCLSLSTGRPASGAFLNGQPHAGAASLHVVSRNRGQPTILSTRAVAETQRLPAEADDLPSAAVLAIPAVPAEVASHASGGASPGFAASLGSRPIC